jgi:hypothetical protein
MNETYVAMPKSMFIALVGLVNAVSDVIVDLPALDWEIGSEMYVRVCEADKEITEVQFMFTDSRLVEVEIDRQ